VEGVGRRGWMDGGGRGEDKGGGGKSRRWVCVKSTSTHGVAGKPSSQRHTALISFPSFFPFFSSTSPLFPPLSHSFPPLSKTTRGTLHSRNGTNIPSNTKKCCGVYENEHHGCVCVCACVCVCVRWINISCAHGKIEPPAHGAWGPSNSNARGV
jgi:hypothetical protein